MSYSFRPQQKQGTEELEYVVFDKNGVPVPPPNTFSSPEAAQRRITELELIDQWHAKRAAQGQRCLGKVVGASESIFVQHIGKEHVWHAREDSPAFKHLKVGDRVEIFNGTVKTVQHEGPTLDF